MIVISRGLARSFRAVARKCVSGRPRGPAPPVVFAVRAGTLIVWTRTADAGLLYQAPTTGADDALVAPMAVLDAVAGAGDDPVELAVGPKLRGVARWADRGLPRTHPFDALLPGEQHRPLESPVGGHPVAAEFLAALHECGRTAARDSGRFALTRVQVKGSAGTVAGTDAQTALLWGGFDLPFPDDVLVPAVPAFGSGELAGEPDVRVGRTATHLVVGAGPWRVVLSIDPVARYPDVAGVIPRSVPSTADLDERDAAELTARLPTPPRSDDDHAVTLDLDGGIVVRARDESARTVTEVRLTRSQMTGPPVQAAVDRRVLARAMALGCLTLRVTPGKPIVFVGGPKTLITVALDPAQIVPPSETSSERAPPVPTTPERRTSVKRPESNGHAPADRHDPPPADVADPLAEAEGLRAALAEAAARAARLVAALRHARKEKKALATVFAGLRQLDLGPGGRP